MRARASAAWWFIERRGEAGFKFQKAKRDFPGFVRLRRLPHQLFPRTRGSGAPNGASLVTSACATSVATLITQAACETGIVGEQRRHAHALRRSTAAILGLRTVLRDRTGLSPIPRVFSRVRPV